MNLNYFTVISCITDCETVLKLAVKEGSRSSGKVGDLSELQLSGKSFGGARV